MKSPQTVTSPESILLVDDEPGVRKALSSILEAEGHNVFPAGSVEEARDLLLFEAPSLLITDIHLPDGSGLDIARTLRRAWPEVPFLVITARGEVETAIDAVRLSAFDYLLKPFKRRALTETVQRALDDRTQRWEMQERINNLEAQILDRSGHAEGLHFGNVYSLVEALEAKDPYTRGHSARVTRYSLSIAEGFRQKVDAEKLRLAATLHDIGKIGVRESTLNKEGPLDDEEWQNVRDHTVVGERIVLPAIDDKEILGAIRSHHERWDGSGYPDGLSGEEIPFLARIIAVADSLDAMTTNRAYRGSRSRGEALAEIREMSGTQFDPEIALMASEIMGRWWWPGQETLYRGARSGA